MKVLTDKRIRKLGSALILCALCGLLYACGGDDPAPSAPSLALNPSDIMFMSKSGDSHSLEIRTDAEWVIVHVPGWLNASSSRGTGSATITLTTNRDNESEEENADQVEIMATSDGGTTSQRITVKQQSGYEHDCFARIMEEPSPLIMSYGICCVVSHGDNTKYFQWKVFSSREFENIRGNNNQILQDITKSASTWNRENISAQGGVNIIYDNCEPNTPYVLVTVAFASNGNNGAIVTRDFTTKDANEQQPIAEIKANKNVVNEVHDGNTGDYYTWDIKKNGTCAGYYTYVCVGDREFETMSRRRGAIGTRDPRDGIFLAWLLTMEMKTNIMTHETSFNAAAGAGCREKMFEVYQNEAPNAFAAKPTDKYIEIMTWGIRGNGDFSGMVYDVVYTVENGVLKEVEGGGYTPTPTEYYLTVSPTSLSYAPEGGTSYVNISSNDEWTVSSSATSWCTASLSSGTGNALLNITVTKNTGTVVRSATVTLKGKNSNKTVTVVVTQSASSPDPTPTINVGRDDYSSDKPLDGDARTLSVNKTSLTFDAAGGQNTVSISGNDQWTASSSNTTFCTVSPASGTGAATLTVKVTQNTGTSARSATVTVKGSYSGNTYTISVSQDKPVPNTFNRTDYGNDKNMN